MNTGRNNFFCFSIHTRYTQMMDGGVGIAWQEMEWKRQRHMVE